MKNIDKIAGTTKEGFPYLHLASKLNSGNCLFAKENTEQLY